MVRRLLLCCCGDAGSLCAAVFLSVAFLQCTKDTMNASVTRESSRGLYVAQAWIRALRRRPSSFSCRVSLRCVDRSTLTLHNFDDVIYAIRFSSVRLTI